MLTDVGNLRVGHASDYTNKTGCTVILFDSPTVAGVDVRGSAPSTKDTDLLRPTFSMPEVHAILLTGGSSFGLEASMGVMKYLEEEGKGFDVGVAKIPIVPAAVIYDLSYGNPMVRPDIKMGIEACKASSYKPFKRGSVGAGTGATVGKIFGMEHASKGGVGTAILNLHDNIKVGAIVVVNAFGDVINQRTNTILASPKDENGNFLNTYECQKKGIKSKSAFNFKNTTIGVVSCNCKLTKEEANRVSTLAQNGIAKAISPAHTSLDGDTIFATGLINTDLRCSVDLIGNAAAEAVELAIFDAIESN